jgi:hypothetical protein
MTNQPLSDSCCCFCANPCADGCCLRVTSKTYSVHNCNCWFCRSYDLYMRKLITVSASSGSRWYTPTDLSTSAALGARVAAATACTHQDTEAAWGTDVMCEIWVQTNPT